MKVVGLVYNLRNVRRILEVQSLGPQTSDTLQPYRAFIPPEPAIALHLRN